MAIKGNLSEASLPDVLQLLALGQKTGCLSVSDRANFGYIYFDRGSITYASIVNRRDRLGDLLVKNGLIDPEQLTAAVEVQTTRSGTRLGEILIERGAISRQQLEKYIRLQIEEAVYFLFTWTQGAFSFEADQQPEEGAMRVSINPESLLLEGARRVDEWSLIEKKIPSLDIVFAPTPRPEGAEEAEFTPEQRTVLPLMDGRRSVQEIIEESGLVEFDAGKALFGLVQAGFAQASGRKQPRPVMEGAARTQEHRNLGIAFYRTGMLDEAGREFARVLEALPDDLHARFYQGLIALRGGDARTAFRELKAVIERGGRWGSAFFNLALALEQLGRVDGALLAVDEGLRLLPGHPPALLSRGIILAKVGRMGEAVEAFASYRAAVGEDDRPSAAYYAFAALAEAAIGRPERGKQLCEEGLRLYPHIAPLLLHAGALRERAGMQEEAEVFYRRAVEEEADLAPARKALGDALYRRGSYEEATEQYRRAVELRPSLGDDVYLKLGNIAYKQGEREGAVDLWTRALRLNPDNGIASTNLELVQKVLAADPA
jgi:tetratricopeptide (TPR) repeat protein